jgi:hypothetical protein
VSAPAPGRVAHGALAITAGMLSVLALAGCATSNTGPDDAVEPNLPATPRPEAEQLAAQRADAREDLNEAQARWARSGVDDYEWSFEVVRPAAVPGRRFDVVVRGRSAVEVRPGRGAGSRVPPFTTVDGAFELLRDHISSGADIVQVSYAVTTGLPRATSIDPTAAVGDELHVTTTAFRAR